MILIGIDPGVKTGLAVWNCDKMSFEKVVGLTAIEVETDILEYLSWLGERASEQMHLRIEDARQRKWYGKNSNEKRMGAGSVKRDCQRWEEFCTHHGINFEMVHPKRNKTKIDAGSFRNLTGYNRRTNEHGRDAAMLVYAFTKQKLKHLIKQNA